MPYGVTYGLAEKQKAEAIVEEMIAQGVGTGGGGGGGAGSATSAKQDTQISQLTNILTNLATLSTSANQSTSNTTLSNILTALGSLSTFAKQDTGNTTLASILARLPALVFGRIPVISHAPAYSRLPITNLAVTQVISAPVKLRGLHVMNNFTAFRTIMLFDAATAPANGTTPLASFGVASNSGTLLLGSDFLGDSFSFVNGLAIACSSTRPTLTADTTPNNQIMLLFE